MMPPAKKKHASKRVTKADHHEEKEDRRLNDCRRAYEHLGRLHTLHPLLNKPTMKQVARLTLLAEQQLKAGRMKDAADLLRASEHLCFGALNPAEEQRVDSGLELTIRQEFRHKREKAEERWAEDSDHHGHLEDIFQSVTERADQAFAGRAYRCALEFARCAEALTHVHVVGGGELEAGKEVGKLAVVSR